jgi:hypothetical protein
VKVTAVVRGAVVLASGKHGEAIAGARVSVQAVALAEGQPGVVDAQQMRVR